MAKGKYEEWLRPDNLLLLQGWARDGLTDEQIAKNIGIRRETLIEWKKRFPNIANTLKKNKEVVDREVENALLKSAEGYYVEEEIWERRFVRSKGDYDLVLTKKTKRHIPPSQVAQIFWLKNRKPEEWREKREYEESDPEALAKARELLADIPSVIE